MAQLDVLICAQASIKNFSLVNKPAYLISPKFSGPEVGLRSEDNYTLLFCETYIFCTCAMMVVLMCIPCFIVNLPFERVWLLIFI